MGSKKRISKYILPIVLKGRKTDQCYIEPFAGGMNIICDVDRYRIANDNNFYLIEMWKKIVDGWIPKEITKEEYLQIKKNKEKYPPYLVGWVGFNCSYSGKWFGGFAGITKTRQGTLRNYQEEAIRNVIKQSKKMRNVVFSNCCYKKLNIPDKSIVYCDPPYSNTTRYADDFDSNQFWQWARNISKQGHKVFVSEYNAPEDFLCLWEKQLSSSLSANGFSGGNKISTEKLFTFNP